MKGSETCPLCRKPYAAAHVMFVKGLMGQRIRLKHRQTRKVQIFHRMANETPKAFNINAKRVKHH